eukprot:g857.t1
MDAKFAPAGESAVVHSDGNRKVFDLIENKLRVSWLAPAVLRVQWDEAGDGKSFHDKKTHAVLNRDLSAVAGGADWKLSEVEVSDSKKIKLESDALVFHFDASKVGSKEHDWTKGLVLLKRKSTGDEPPKKWNPEEPYAGSLFGTTAKGEVWAGNPKGFWSSYNSRMIMDCAKERQRIVDKHGSDQVFGTTRPGGGVEGFASMHCIMGVLNGGETGISVIDDSDMPIFPDASNQNQHKKAPGSHESGVINGQYAKGQLTSIRSNKDLYFFAFGGRREKGSYKRALAALRELSGPQPLVPRYTFGYWLSFWKWCTMRDENRRGGLPTKGVHAIPFTTVAFDGVLKNMFESLGIPIDTWVLDMQWIGIDGGPGNIVDRRNANGKAVGLGTEPAWGAWKYDRNMGDLVAWHKKVTSKGLQVSINVHPHVGVLRKGDADWLLDKDFNEITKAIGCHVDANNEGGCFWGDHAEKAKFLELLDDVASPLRKDFIPWWDWQHGDYRATSKPVSKCHGSGALLTCGNYPTKNWHPLMALNRVNYGGAERRKDGRRGLQMGRASGWGTHRYPLHFVGDNMKDWDSLAFAPYWTVTAANAGVGYWTNDLICCDWGDGERYQNWAKYMRWLQFGAVSSVMRTHDKGAGGNSGGEMGAHMLFWDYPMPLMHAAKHLVLWRSMLVPYLYTSALHATYTGVSIARPLYYDWPEFAESYVVIRRQEDWREKVPFSYMLGDALLVNPIVKGNNADTLYPSDMDVPREADYGSPRIRKLGLWTVPIDRWPVWLPPLAPRGEEGGDPSGNTIGQPFWYDLTHGRVMRAPEGSEKKGFKVPHLHTFLVDEFPLFQRSDLIVPLTVRKFVVGSLGRERWLKLVWQAVAPPQEQFAGGKATAAAGSSPAARESLPVKVQQRGHAFDDAHGLSTTFAADFRESSCVLRWLSRTVVFVHLAENREGTAADDAEAQESAFALFLHNMAVSIVSASFFPLDLKADVLLQEKELHEGKGSAADVSKDLEASWYRDSQTDGLGSTNTHSETQRFGLRTVSACVFSCTRVQGLKPGVTRLELKEEIPADLLQGLRGAERKVARETGKREIFGEAGEKFSEADAKTLWDKVEAGASKLHKAAQELRK